MTRRAGPDAYGNPGRPITNQGNITVEQAGLAALVAPGVSNQGTITAKLGRVTLASGDTFTLDTYGDNLISFAVSPQVTQQLVQNSGVIQAEGGTVTLTAAAGSQVVNSLINMSGVITADSAGVGQNGEIILYAEGSNAVANNVTADKGLLQGNSTVLVSGTLSAAGYGTGQTGGTVEVLGDHIALLSNSTIDVSGNAQAQASFVSVATSTARAQRRRQNSASCNRHHDQVQRGHHR